LTFGSFPPEQTALPHTGTVQQLQRCRSKIFGMEAQMNCYRNKLNLLFRIGYE
jgi:hypothetical protein